MLDKYIFIKFSLYVYNIYIYIYSWEYLPQLISLLGPAKGEKKERRFWIAYSSAPMSKCCFGSIGVKAQGDIL